MTKPRFDTIPVGSAVTLDFRDGTRSTGNIEPALFLGITGTGEARSAKFVQVAGHQYADDTPTSYEWEAYRYLGRWVYGSSADTLRLVAITATPTERF